LAEAGAQSAQLLRRGGFRQTYKQILLNFLKAITF
jgi:hypothetical protein